MASRQFLPTQHPVVDPKTGIITQPWLELFKSAVAAVEAGAGSTVWSTLNGVTDWRTLASLLTPAIVGNALPAGVVKQVVFGSTTTQTSSSSSTFADTALSAAITLGHANNKVLVIVIHGGAGKSTGNTYLQAKLQRGTTDLVTFENRGGDTADATQNNIGAIAGVYLDTPGSVGPHTYKTQIASGANIATAYVGANNSAQMIALLEVQG